MNPPMPNRLRPNRHARTAFSLIEVMIAIAIFFLASFAILSLTSSALENARRLQRPMVDAGLVAAQLDQTNKLVEGMDSGDLGKAFPGYTWTSATTEVGSNKLFEVDIILQSNARNKPVVSKMSVLYYSPRSSAGSLDGGISK